MKQMSRIDKSGVRRAKAKYLGFGVYSYDGGNFVIRRRFDGEPGWKVSNHKGELVTHGKTVKDAVAKLEKILYKELEKTGGDHADA